MQLADYLVQRRLFLGRNRKVVVPVLGGVDGRTRPVKRVEHYEPGALVEHGAEPALAEEIGHQVLQPGGAGWQRQERFATSKITSNVHRGRRSVIVRQDVSGIVGGRLDLFEISFT